MSNSNNYYISNFIISVFMFKNLMYKFFISKVNIQFIIWAYLTSTNVIY